jgi:hypothetical protein
MPPNLGNSNELAKRALGHIVATAILTALLSGSVFAVWHPPLP